MTEAHGLPGGPGLPVSVAVAAGAAAAALVTTYVALLVAWRRPRLQRGAHRTLPRLTRFVDARPTRYALRGAGLLALVVFLAAAWLGPDSALTNPVPTWFYVWFWVGLVPASLLAGPVWRVLNPLRSLAGLLSARRPAPRPTIPEALQGWPAEAAVLAVLWLELVSDSAASPRTIGVLVAAYAVVHVVAGIRYGPEWFARNDGFEVYSSLFARLAPVGRDADGLLVLRSPLRALASTPSRADPTLLILVLLGGTAYDGLRGTDLWGRVSYDGRSEYLVVGSLGLVLVIATVLLTYGLALAATHGLAGSTRDLYREFAPPLIPVAAGYIVAHYLAFALLQGPQGVVLAADPFGLGWDLVPVTVVPSIVLPATVTALLQVGAIVVGHLVAVVCVHDRALDVLPARSTRRAQVPLLVVMVGYTMAGIALLAGG